MSNQNSNNHNENGINNADGTQLLSIIEQMLEKYCDPIIDINNENAETQIEHHETHIEQPEQSINENIQESAENNDQNVVDSDVIDPVVNDNYVNNLRENMRRLQYTQARTSIPSLRSHILRRTLYNNTLNQNQQSQEQENNHQETVQTESHDVKKCRFCYETDEPLISPCKCTGSVAYVHERCLLSEIPQNPTMKCTICNSYYSSEITNEVIDKYFPHELKKYTLLSLLGISGFLSILLLYDQSLPIILNEIGYLTIMSYITSITFIHATYCWYNYYLCTNNLDINQILESIGLGRHIEKFSMLMKSFIYTHYMFGFLFLISWTRADHNNYIGNFMLRTIIISWIFNILVEVLTMIFKNAQKDKKLTFKNNGNDDNELETLLRNAQARTLPAVFDITFGVMRG